MIVLGLLLLIGGVFSAFIGGYIVDWRSKDAVANAGKFMVALSLVAACVGFGLIVVGAIRLCIQPRCYYTIDAHYLNGDVLRLRMKGYNEPHISSYKGSYWIETELENEQAVIRYDLVRVDTIKDEQ